MSSDQWYVVIFLAFYFGVIIGVRSMLLYKNTKIDATQDFGEKEERQNAERVILVALALLLFISIVFVAFPSYYSYFIPIPFFQTSWIQTIGFITSMLGLTITFIAQLQMKDSWRLTMGDQKEIKLITTGFFAYSRNPIYIALIISFLGYFFIVPSLGSILFLFIMCFGIIKKVSDEEKFLHEKFGQEFHNYQSRVNRWI